MGSTRAESHMVRWLAGPGPAWLRRWLDGVGGWVTQRDYAGKPDYLPSRTFAMAIFDTLAPATKEPLTVERLYAAARELATVGDPGRPVCDHTRDLLSEIQRRVCALRGASTGLKEAVDPSLTYSRVLVRLSALPESEQRDMVICHLRAGQS